MHMKSMPKDRPQLLPVFDLMIYDGGDAFAHAQSRAAAGGAAGDLLWVPHDDRLDCAVILVPNPPLEDVGVARRLSLVALADALARAAPPQCPVGMAPPGALLVDGAQAGVVHAASIGAAVVVGVTVRLTGDEAPGLRPERTSLRDEGFEDVDAVDLLEAFTRHLLRWIDVWEQDGPAPLEQAWQARLSRLVLPSGAKP